MSFTAIKENGKEKVKKGGKESDKNGRENDKLVSREERTLRKILYQFNWV